MDSTGALNSKRTSGKSLLWSLESPSGDVSLLFGTMHVRSSVAHQFIDQVVPWLASCNLLAAEMSLDEFDQTSMIRGSSLPDDGSLEQVLGLKGYRKVRSSLMKSFAIDLDHFKHRHPFLVSAAISESLLVNDQLESLDQEIWNRAMRLNKTCLGLESFAKQMEIMQSIPLDDAIRQLRSIARNPPRFRRNLHKMIKLYVDQDVNGLYRSSRKQLEGLRRKLLFDRNRDMANRLVDLMQGNTVFAAVGAAHLGGEKGMLRLIKKQGYRVKPIKINL